MSVQEIGDLHRRYVDLSQRFRAGWVYHQFVESLAKAEGDTAVPAAAVRAPLADRFQQVYAELKDCSQRLSSAEAESLQGRFDDIERRIGELHGELLAQDSKIPPPSLRLFFQQFRNYDEKILVQLIRFYVFACEDGDWTANRKDKVDYLVTRLGEEQRRGSGGPGSDREGGRLGEIFASLWALLEAEQPNPQKIASLRRAVDEIRAELVGVGSLDDLTGSEKLAQYRELKHSLGELFFEPTLLAAILDTNLAFRDTVQRLYSNEERRIAADHQRIFDLERAVPADSHLDRELSEFREAVERFETHVQHNDLRLDDLARLRERARDLIPKLAAHGDQGPGWSEEPDSQELWSELAETMPTRPAERSAAAPAPAAEPGGPHPLLATAYEHLTETLSGASLGALPRSVVLSPELYPLGLEAREVVAFRRLLGHGGGDERWDEEGERFVLEAAALRLTLGEETETLREALDETLDETRDASRARARRLASLGDSSLRTFDHLQHQALLDGRGDEARALALLRVRLMREYAELWLLAYQDLRG